MADSGLDEQRVIDYLTRLMSGRFFQIEDLDALTTQDLVEDTPVQDVDRSVLEKTLVAFKIKYKSEIFKESGE
jgi:hypothetical protein